MMRASLLLSLLFFVGCAASPVVEYDLYKKYSDLSALVASDSIVKEKNNYFTGSYLNEVNDEDEKSLFLLETAKTC